MIKLRNENYENTFYLFIIICAGFFLRLYKLDFQSLWVDELHTLIECNPEISWYDTTTAVLTLECKSPLYFYLIKIICSVFGYTSLIARLVSVIAGTAGIYAMYLLGKEIFDKRIGLIASALICVNYFHIYYSQEARGYTLYFLFTVLSFLFFIKTLKTLTKKNAILYGVTTLLSLHFHPFAILVIIAQGLLTLIFFLSEENKIKMTLFKRFFLGYLIIIIGFAPLITNVLTTVSSITESWIPKPTQGYFVDYFYEFFGYSELLKPVLLTIIICYLANAFISKDETNKYSGISFSFMLISVSLVTVFLIPYLYSILRIPVVVSRYLINILPLFLLMISTGIGMMQNKFVRGSILFIFVIISLLDLFIIKDYYNVPTKTQFRELAEYVKLNSDKPYLILTEKTPWQQSYYMNLFEIKSELKQVKKEAFVDSLITSYQSSVFWLIGAHGDERLTPQKEKLLETRFLLAKSRDFLDAWARLYIPIDNGGNSTKLNYNNFRVEDTNVILGDSVITLWEENLRISKPVALSPGNYTIRILSNGTPYKKVFPHLNVYINDSLIGNYFTGPTFESSPAFHFKKSNTDSILVKIKMDNDENAGGKEDRNGFIKTIYLIKD